MKTNKLLVLALAVLSLSLYNCSNDENAPSTNETSFTLGKIVSRDFSGTIVDSDNNALAGVVVKIGSTTVETNAEGKFTLTNVSVPTNFAYFTATKNGFVQGSRAVVTHEGTNDLKIMMLPINIVATIASGVTSNVVLSNTSKITFDGSFKTENGEAYNGNVKVVVNSLDANDPFVFDKMPGNLLGKNTAGSIVGMKTFGMINVELLGDNNQKVQIANGHKALMSLKIADEQLAYAPDSIPLWHFNTTSGLWEEEGFSTRVGNKYETEVSHFSIWNNDWAYVVATLNVLVKNFDNTPVVGVRVTISSELVIEKHTNLPLDILLGTTGPNGTLSAGVPTNVPLTFKAFTQDGELINEQILPASSQLTRNVTIIIPIQNRVANPKG